MICDLPAANVARRKKRWKILSLSLFLSFLFLFLFLPSLLSIDPFRFNFAGRQPADATSAHLPAGRWCTIRCTGSDAWNLGENRASVNCFFDPWNGLQSNRGVTFFFVCFFSLSSKVGWQEIEENEGWDGDEASFRKYLTGWKFLATVNSRIWTGSE